MSEHSELLSPSASGLWLKCTAQPRAVKEANFPYEDSEAAKMGTWKHNLAEEMFMGLLEVTDKPEDMDEYDWNEVVVAYNEAIKFMPPEGEGVELGTEVKVHFDDWRNDCFGTVDLLGLDAKNRTLYVGDYKFGRTPVAVIGNTQIKVYGLAAAYMFMAQGHIIEHVKFAIIQPKIQHDAMTDEVSFEELKQWDENVLIPAQKAILDNIGTQFVPGPHCAEKYCPLHKAGICEKSLAAVNQMASEIMDLNEDDSEVDVRNYLHLLSNKKLIVDTINTLFAKATELAKLGETVEGFKLVKGKGKRIWKDEDKAAKYLKGKLTKTETYTEKMVTAPQAEILLKKAGKLDHGKSVKAFEAQIEYQEGGLTLVKDDNPKPAIVVEDDLEQHYQNEEESNKEIDEIDSLFDDLL